MKLFILFTLFTVSTWASSGLKGVVKSSTGCQGNVMVWLSVDKENYKERLLITHTEVPVGGSFQFYLKPGNYQLRGSDQSGCESLQRVTVKSETIEVMVQVKKK